MFQYTYTQLYFRDSAYKTRDNPIRDMINYTLPNILHTLHTPQSMLYIHSKTVSMFLSHQDYVRIYHPSTR